MKPRIPHFNVLVACALLAVPLLGAAQAMPPASITTPGQVESRIGTLEFKDGVPSKATAEKLYDQIDFTYAYRAFMDNMRDNGEVHRNEEGTPQGGSISVLLSNVYLHYV